MTVLDTVPTDTVPTDTVPTDTVPSTVHVPRQAAAADPLVTAPPAVTASPLLGRDRPLTTDERQFAIGLAVLALVLGTIIVGGLLLGQYVWS